MTIVFIVVTDLAVFVASTKRSGVGNGHFGRRNCNIVKYTRSPGVQCSVSPVLFVMFMSMNLDFCLFLDNDDTSVICSRQKNVFYF